METQINSKSWKCYFFDRVSKNLLQNKYLQTDGDEQQILLLTSQASIILSFLAFSLYQISKRVLCHIHVNDLN